MAVLRKVPGLIFCRLCTINLRHYSAIIWSLLYKFISILFIRIHIGEQRVNEWQLGTTTGVALDATL